MQKLIKSLFPWFVIVLFLSGLLYTSCRKEVFTTDPSAKLTFSADTIQFDTVFSTVGSATKNFRVKNPNNKAVKINIALAGGENSPFRININGKATTRYDNFELSANDSFFVFVEVTIDPGNQNLPFIVMDSILFETNGNVQKMPLVAFGQDAHFFKGYVIGDSIWTNDKPYVIYKYLGVAGGSTLTIMPGVRIYSHSGAGILVAGKLVVNGTKDEPVIFRGDRLEHVYDNEPGQWYGIRFLPKSENNMIKHAMISNGVVGIEADSLPVTANGTNITIEKTIIKNMTVAGIVGYTSTIKGTNDLIHSCGQYTFVGALGGNYDFVNCTFDNTSTVTTHRVPSFWLTNTDYVDKEKGITIYNDLNAGLRNCIIWGTLDDEVKIQHDGHGKLDTLFRNNIVRNKDVKFGPGNLNKNPKFKDPYNDKFQLDTLSPSMDFGIYFPTPHLVTDDIEDNSRDSRPDAGAYERKQ